MPFSYSTNLSHLFIPCGSTDTKLTASVIYRNQSFSLLLHQCLKFIRVNLISRATKPPSCFSRYLSPSNHWHSGYPFGLTLPYLLPLLLRHCSHDFNQNVIDHLANPILSMEVHQCSRNIKHPDNNTMLLEPLQLGFDFRFIPSKPV